MIFEEICRRYDLGELIEEPVPLKGGYLHRVYSLFTSRDRYVVKLLNPHIMQRGTAQENYWMAELLEKILESCELPILPALSFGERKMQEIDGTCFYLYPWYPGKALTLEEIEPFHCREMGKVLARIHAVDVRESEEVPPALSIDWESYGAALSGEKDPLGKQLQESCDMLSAFQEQRNLAVGRLPRRFAICHNDMDPKNVLWRKRNADGTLLPDSYRIIDLECLSYANPLLELFQTALYWSGYPDHFSSALFGEFVAAYRQEGGKVPENREEWEALYYSCDAQLNWLEYNLKRALGLECDAEERELGRDQALDALLGLLHYFSLKEEILNCSIKKRT